jgi:isochorismate synthase
MKYDTELGWNFQKPFALCSPPNSIDEYFFSEQKGKLVTKEGLEWWCLPFDEGNQEDFSTDKELYLSGIRSTIEALQGGEMQKVVISRVLRESILLDDAPALIRRLFHALREKYPSAFVFAHSQEENKIWIGATPEVLVEGEKDNMQTVALAGTRKATGSNTQWGQKEIGEQQNVVDFIQQILKSADAYQIDCTLPFTVSAGPIEHIKSLISFKSNHAAEFIAQQLHPTSAVCGMPREKAINWIQQIEKHHRSFYAGIIGFRKEVAFQYYVQLRCALLNLEDHSITYYAGGGIMADSDPESEWMETENKIAVMREVVKKIEQTKGI